MPKVVVEVGDVIDQFMKYDAEIKRMREALHMLADLDNWDDMGHWAAAWDSGTPWEIARTALREKE